jgi:hypothetical protein
MSGLLTKHNHPAYSDSKKDIGFLKLLNLFFAIVLWGYCQISHLQAQPKARYDLVLTGGRVIDPETNLDAVRNIGIQNGRIIEVTSEPIVGKETIKVSGLVVAPGFIDMHVHGIGNL